MYHQLERFSARKLELVTGPMKNRSLQQEVALYQVKEDKMALVIRSNIRTRSYPESILPNLNNLQGNYTSFRNVRNSGGAVFPGDVSPPLKEESQSFQQYLDDTSRHVNSSQSEAFAPSAPKADPPLDHGFNVHASRTSLSVPSVPIEGLFLAPTSSHMTRVKKRTEGSSSTKLESSKVRNTTLGQLNQEAALTSISKGAVSDAANFTKYDVSVQPAVSLFAQANSKYRTAFKLLLS
jgi:hypothetical protein